MVRRFGAAYLGAASRVESALKRFRREVAVARDADSSRLVRVYDLGEAGETVFLTMELVEGESLRRAPARARILSRYRPPANAWKAWKEVRAAYPRQPWARVHASVVAERLARLAGKAGRPELVREAREALRPTKR